MLTKLKQLREANEEGFTLIELLVVIVIIGVLAAIALPIFLNQQKAAIAAGVKSDVKGVNTAVATYLTKAGNQTADTVAGAVTDGVTTFLGQRVSVSDKGTIITVSGKWDDYSISAVNTNLTGFSYSYSSTTGKYTTVGG